MQAQYLPVWAFWVGHHFLWSAITLLVYVVSTRVVGERRPPTVAIAWVMGLLLLPYAVLPLYLIFGRRKIAVAPVGPTAAIAARVKAERLWPAALLESFGLTQPSTVDVRFHSDGAGSRAALWEILDSAQRTLDVSTFLIADDVLGREVLDRLTHRARAGVRVRLLIDGAGEWLARRPSFEPLRKAGGQVVFFHPLFSLGKADLRNLRNHRKLVVADDERLWSGGRNFAAEYFCGATGHEPWIDLSFNLQGGVATAAARRFAADWAAAGRGSTAQSQPPIAKLDRSAGSQGSLAQFLPSGPDQPEDNAQSLLVAACYRAQRRILAVTPYFVPNESLLTAMRLAALRGVRVLLVIPAVSNHRLADFVRGRGLRALDQAGALIRVVPRMVHAKAVVVDDTFAMCGSINLDARSLLINYESAVVFYGMEQIAWLASWIEALSERSSTPKLSAPGFGRDVAEGLLLTIAFQL
jgi:cardiolipin synthase